MLWSYERAVVEVQADSGLVVADARGEICVGMAARIIADAPGWAPQVHAKVVDYSRARLMLTADSLYGASFAARPGQDEPAAFIVQPDQLALFKRYAAMCAERGVLKAAFTRVDQALGWAAEQAQVQRYWAQLAQTHRPSP
jgi:hypothetical protein